MVKRKKKGNAKMNCKLCKKKEATNFTQKDWGICDSCYIEIINSFTYYIGEEEVTKEQYQRRIKNE